jgi:hypothetical protein
MRRCARHNNGHGGREGGDEGEDGGNWNSWMIL